jgi:hypothetical protein
MIRKVALYSFPLGIVIYYFIPILFRYNVDSNLVTYLILLIVTYFIGCKFPLAYNVELKPKLFSKKSIKKITFTLAVVCMIIFIINNGIQNIFGGNFREYIYVINNQWENVGWYRKINQYIGMLSLFFVTFCGWQDGLNKKITLVSVLWVMLNVIPRLLISSRLFFLGIIIYLIAFITSSNIKFKFLSFKSILFLCISFLAFYWGIGKRFDMNEVGLTEIVLKPLDGLNNLDFVFRLKNTNYFDFEYFLYHWTPIPSSFFDIPETNLTYLKYDINEGSSEPMPLIASAFYLQGWYSLIYSFILGSLVSGISTVWKQNKSFFNFCILLAILYMTLVYHNHSGWRAVSRFFIILMWLKIFLFYNSKLAVRYKLNKSFT